jgi:hypothetical protein
MLGVPFAPRRLDRGDIDLVMMRDMRDSDPVAAEKAARQFLDARNRFDFDLAKFLEIRRRQRCQPAEQCGDIGHGG